MQKEWSLGWASKNHSVELTHCERLPQSPRTWLPRASSELDKSKIVIAVAILRRTKCFHLHVSQKSIPTRVASTSHCALLLLLVLTDFSSKSYGLLTKMTPKCLVFCPQIIVATSPSIMTFLLLSSHQKP